MRSATQHVYSPQAAVYSSCTFISPVQNDINLRPTKTETRKPIHQHLYRATSTSLLRGAPDKDPKNNRQQLVILKTGTVWDVARSQGVIRPTTDKERNRSALLKSRRMGASNRLGRWRAQGERGQQSSYR